MFGLLAAPAASRVLSFARAVESHPDSAAVAVVFLQIKRTLIRSGNQMGLDDSSGLGAPSGTLRSAAQPGGRFSPVSREVREQVGRQASWLCRPPNVCPDWLALGFRQSGPLPQLGLPQRCGNLRRRPVFGGSAASNASIALCPRRLKKLMMPGLIAPVMPPMPRAANRST
jgi:hypothetical protein